MSNTVAQLFVLLGGIVTIAIVAVVVSKNAQTPSVISTFFSGFSQSISAAVSPITGGGNSGMQIGSLGLTNLGIG
jgi:hypothetical protein